MKILANIRKAQSPWARTVLGLYVAVWLSIVLQPCAVAFEAGRSCQSCPQSIKAEATSGEQAMADGLHGIAAQCAFPNELNYDCCMTKLKIKIADGPIDMPIAVVPSIAIIGYDKNPPADFDTRNIAGLTASESLNILNCVYLI